MRISDWSSDVCSSDLHGPNGRRWFKRGPAIPDRWFPRDEIDSDSDALDVLRGTKDRTRRSLIGADAWFDRREAERYEVYEQTVRMSRSEEHTSELQSLMRISYAVFCLKKKTQTNTKKENNSDM